MSFRGLAVNLLLGGLLVAALRFKQDSRISVLAGFTFLVAIVGSPMFVAATAATSSVLVNPAGRYGLSLLPVFVLALANSLRGRIPSVALTIIACITYLVGVGAMVSS
jgi:hypothetical protein